MQRNESVPSILESEATGKVAEIYADAVRRAIDLPAVPSFSRDTLAAAGLSNDDVVKITDILDSYYYTNALALVVLSALVMHFEPTQQSTVRPRTVHRGLSEENRRNCR